MSKDNRKYEYVRHWGNKTVKIDPKFFTQKRTDNGLIDIVFIGDEPSKIDEKDTKNIVKWRLI